MGGLLGALCRSVRDPQALWAQNEMGVAIVSEVSVVNVRYADPAL